MPSHRPARTSGRLPVIAELRVERTLERGPCRAAIDIGREDLILAGNVTVVERPQHGRHHEVAGSEVIAIEKWLAAERVRQSGEPAPEHARDSGRRRSLMTPAQRLASTAMRITELGDNCHPMSYTAFA